MSGTGDRGGRPGRTGRTAKAAMAFLLLWMGFSVHRAWRSSADPVNDFATFFLASQDVSGGRDPYREKDRQSPYIYPPLFLWLVTPLTKLDFRHSAVLWSILTVGILAATAWFSARLARAGPAAPAGPPPPGWGLVLVPLLIAFRFALREVSQGQVNALVSGLTLAALMALLSRRDLLAGSLIALATAIKILPAGFLLPLLLARRFRAAAAVLVALPLWLALPGATWGPGRLGEVLDQWRHGRFLHHATELSLDTHTPNQSLWAAMMRTLTPASTRPPHEPPRYVNLLDLEARTATGLHALAAAALLLAFVAARRAAGDRLPALVTTWALTWPLIHLISKKTWEEHLVTLILPLAILVGTGSRRILAVITGLLWIHTPLLVGRELSDRIQGHSPATVALLVLFFALLRHRGPVAAATDVAAKEPG